VCPLTIKISYAALCFNDVDAALCFNDVDAASTLYDRGGGLMSPVPEARQKRRNTTGAAAARCRSHKITFWLRQCPAGGFRGVQEVFTPRMLDGFGCGGTEELS
jgi:hypothetical protein